MLKRVLIVALTFAGFLLAVSTAQAQLFGVDRRAADAAIAECDRTLKPPPRTSGTTTGWVRYNECVNAAEQYLLEQDRKRGRHPDLRQLIFSTRIAIAEKVDAGQMSYAEANRQLDQIFVQVESEYQRRQAANLTAPYLFPSPTGPNAGPILYQHRDRKYRHYAVLLGCER